MNQSVTPAYAIPSTLETIDHLAVAISKWAEQKGFWRPVDNLNPKDMDTIRRMKKFEKVMLVVTELAELVEGLRKPPILVEGTDITNEEEEVADAIIRLLDYSGHYHLRIGHAIGVKMAKNEGRPYMHGKLA